MGSVQVHRPEVVTEDAVHSFFPPRKKWSKKYDYGHLLIVGGSHRYTGAITLAALAALRTGVDLVTTVAPERAANTAASINPNVISIPLEGKFLSKNHLKDVLELSENCDAVLLGCGTERRKETIEFFSKFCRETTRPCVLDAGATFVSREFDRVGKKFILTMHAYEFFLASGFKVGESVDDRVQKALRFAKKTGAVVLLKGYVDVISDGERCFLNRTGNPFMTKAGTGDVLAGICSALLAMSKNALESAKVGAYLCGKAGDLAAGELAQGMLATDVIERIPLALGR